MNTKKFLDDYGTWALVTGASSGIGKSFAEELAAIGFNLVLAARRRDEMEELAAELKAAHNCECRVLAIDLTREGFYKEVEASISDLDIGLLVNNAGMNCEGKFYRGGLERNVSMIRLNVEASFILAHELGRRFIDQGRGGIIFVSSTSAFQPMPFFTHYAATKAYVLSLAQSMHYEFRSHGVHVTALCPGPTESEMSKGLEGQPYVMKAAPVVRAGLKALGRRTYVVPGFGNKVGAAFPRLVGSRVAMEVVGATLKRALPANRK